MKYFLLKALFALFLILPAQLFASHIVGYDLAMYPAPQGQNYIVKLKLYRSNSPWVVVMQQRIDDFRIFPNGSINSIYSFSLERESIYVSVASEEICAPATNTAKIEVGVFTATIPANIISTLTNPNGYYLSGSTCCRNTGIKNITPDSQNFGMIFTLDFPRLNTTSPYKGNSSPVFMSDWQSKFCVNRPVNFNWNVVDPDGDSLVYSLINPLDIGPATKPFDVVHLAAGYRLDSNIIDGNPGITIDPQTGTIDFTPTQLGYYVLSFMVEEYRNGIKIGHVIRDMEIEIVLCNPLIAPVIQDITGRNTSVTDTINLGELYTIDFISRDQQGDSVFMYIIPDKTSASSNIFNPALNAIWGPVGYMVGGVTAEKLILSGKDSIQARLRWQPTCFIVSDEPYQVKIVTYDNTCSALQDTLSVNLFVTKFFNYPPVIFLPDTITTNVPITKRYDMFIGDTLEINIKAADQNQQWVEIDVIPDPSNGTHLNKNALYSSLHYSDTTLSTFKLIPQCVDFIGRPYRFTFVASDDDCKTPDSVSFIAEIYAYRLPDSVALPQINRTEDTLFTKNIYAEYQWYLNDQIIPNENTYKLAINSGGTYKVKVTEFCEVFSDPYLITGIGVEDSNNDFVIYPNPSDNDVFIKSDKEITDVKLINAYGQLIYQSKEHTDKINISSFGNGIYFLKISDRKGQIFTYRIVKY